MIICSDNASFALPEAQLGIVPDSGGGVLRLPKRLPPLQLSMKCS